MVTRYELCRAIIVGAILLAYSLWWIPTFLQLQYLLEGR